MKKTSILLCICLLIGSHQIKSQTSVDLSQQPDCDSTLVLFCLKDTLHCKAVYAKKSGFTDAKAKRIFGKLIRPCGIIEIKPAFRIFENRPFSNIYLVRTRNGMYGSKLMEHLNGLEQVRYAEFLPLYYPMLQPNDYSNQQTTYLNHINATTAWDITQGSPNVTIAVVDDAIRVTHEDLSANCWTNPLEIPGNNLDDDTNGYVDDYKGYDVSDMDNDPAPPAWATINLFSHGSHVAGIAAASTNNGTGISSIGFNCKYIPVKCKPDSSTGLSLPDAYLGLEYAISLRPDIINMSWGGMAYSSTYQLLCDTAYDLGIVLVAAAGNTGTNMDLYPASYNHVISVGSTNLNDVASMFSTYGTRLDVMAPGVNIYSCLGDHDQSYGFKSGTSMAAPLVSGICGLMLANNPGMTVDEVEMCLRSGCANINIQNPTKIGLLGSGRVDAFGAVTCAEGPPFPHVCHGGNGCMFVCPGHTITFNGTSLGLSATSWFWQFPGGNPSTSALQNPTVTYPFPGLYDVIVSACNSFGCDTVVFQNLVCSELPEAYLSSENSGMYCEGSVAYLDIGFLGVPPFSFVITDGTQLDTLTGIYSNPYSLEVLPTHYTHYALVSMTDALCTGDVYGTVTINPVPCGPCSNTDFEFGNFTTWKGRLGQCCGMGTFTPGLVSGRQTIMSGSGTDPYSLGNIPLVPAGGGSYSARLGNYYVNGQAEILEKSFIVTPDNTSFTYEFAVVLEDPCNHAPEKKPKFEIRVMDNNGVLIPDSCAYYQVTAGHETDDWEHNGLIRYKTWMPVTIDLTNYLGQTLKVQFKTEDCGLMGHFGYAYLDAHCNPMEIEIINYCDTTDTITLNAPIGFITYEWHPSGDTTPSILIPAPQTGDTVSVTMTNVAGCTSTTTHVFNVLPVPDAIISGDTLICAQDTALLFGSGAGPGGTYQWYSDPPGFTSNQQNIIVMPEQTTTYYLEVTNSNGCPADSVPGIIVQVDEQLAFDLGADHHVCYFDTVTLVAPFNNDSLMWTSYPPGFISAEDTIHVLPSTPVYYILTRYNQSCSYSDEVLVSLYDYYFDNPITQYPVCSGTTSITLYASQGYSGCQWLETGDTTCQLTINNIINYAIYSVAMVSPYGCPDTLRFILDPVPDPEANAGNDTSVCKGLAVQLSATGANTNQGTYNWSSIPPGFYASSQQVVVAPLVSTYYIVEVTNGPGCPSPVSYDTVLVVVHEAPEFELGPDVEICRGDSVIMNISVPEGFNYWFSDPPGFYSEDSTVVLKPDSTTYFYLTINTDICTWTDFFRIKVIEGGVLTDTINLMFCPDDTMVLVAAPPGYTEYYWLNNGDTVTDFIYYPSSSDSLFTLLVKPAGGICFDTILLWIREVNTSYIPQISAYDTLLCSGDSITLSVDFQQGVEFGWWADPGISIAQNTDSVTVKPEDTTLYYIITSEYGCESSDSIIIYVTPTPEFSLPDSVAICYGEIFSTGSDVVAESLWWHDGNTDSVRPLTEKGDYILYTLNGTCGWSDTLHLEIISDSEASIPNVFTPNGDGYNDMFQVIVPFPEEYSLTVFDRWGKTTFHSDNIELMWDGRNNRDEYPAGVYYYLCRYKSRCLKKTREVRGFLHLIR